MVITNQGRIKEINLNNEKQASYLSKFIMHLLNIYFIKHLNSYGLSI